MHGCEKAQLVQTRHHSFRWDSKAHAPCLIHTGIRAGGRTNFISKFVSECDYVPLILSFAPGDSVIIIYVNVRLCVNQQNELNPS